MKVSFISKIAVLLATLVAALPYCFADEPQYELFDIGDFEAANRYELYPCGPAVFLSANGKVTYLKPYLNKSFIFEPLAGEVALPGYFDPSPTSYTFVAGIDDEANIVGLAAHLAPNNMNVLEFMSFYLPQGGVPQAIDTNLPGFDAFFNSNRAHLSAGSSNGKHFIGTVRPQPTEYTKVVNWTDKSPSVAETIYFDGARGAYMCAINNLGDAVGATSSPTDPIIRRAGGGYQLITSSSIGVDTLSIPQVAVAINNSGAILLTQPTTERFVQHAALLDGTSFLILSGMDQGYGLNDFGEVVGDSSPDYNQSFEKYRHAVIYKGGEFLDMNKMIDPTLGIFLTKAIAINNSRTVIAVGFDSSKATHTYYLRETTPTYQPDLSIGVGAKAAGINIFESTGAQQTVALTLKVAKSKTVQITLRNAGKVSDSFTLKGSRSSAKFSLKYLAGKTDITSLVTSGKYKITKLPSNASTKISVVLKALKKSATRSKFNLQATSQTDTTKIDKIVLTATSK